MHSGHELKDLSSLNYEEKDQSISCPIMSNYHLSHEPTAPPLPEIMEEQLKLNNLIESAIVDDSISNEKYLSEIQSDMLHILTGLYAQLLVVIISTTLFTELLHQHMQLFYSHEYLFFYLLVTSILLLSGALFLIGIRFILIHTGYLCKKPHYLSKRFVNEFNKLDIDLSLRIGMHIFGLAVVISSGFEVKSALETYSTCLTASNVSHTVLQCIFIGLQLLFFLMGSKEIWTIFGCMKKFAFMHLFATNLALYIRLFLWESAKDWEAALHIKHNSSLKWDKNEFNITVHSLESDINSEDLSKHTPNHVVYYTYNCWWRIDKSDEIDIISIQSCLENSTYGILWSEISKFLYLVATQYYFIVLCVLYFIWVNIDSKKIVNFPCVISKRCKNDHLCSRSTKGLFLGLIVFIATIIMMIIFFSSKILSCFTIRIFYCIIFVLSLSASFLGIIQCKIMQKKDLFDSYYVGFLQSAGVLAIYFYATCNILAGITSEEKFSFVICLEAVFMILHTSIQNILIIQISRKKIDDSNVNEKPGRQAVVFLIFCNLCLWLIECFISWNLCKLDLQKVVFGQIAWPLIIRITFPFIVFYRYHSFVSLLKIWKRTYV